MLITEALDFFCSTDASVVLCGDFNLPQINWANLDVVCDSLGGSFTDCLQANALIQCVEDATRGGNIF